MGVQIEATSRDYALSSCSTGVDAVIGDDFVEYRAIEELNSDLERVSVSVVAPPRNQTKFVGGSAAGKALGSEAFSEGQFRDGLEAFAERDLVARSATLDESRACLVNRYKQDSMIGRGRRFVFAYGRRWSSDSS